MNDSRLSYILALLDDARTGIADIEDESPPQQYRGYLHNARVSTNAAIRSLKNAQAAYVECEVCGGRGEVMRAKRLENGFDWLAGDRITCPSCTK